MAKETIHKNRIIDTDNTCILFIDMNSFFASCEQQVNYYLRGRPVAVCVYTGKFGAIISPSIEAKNKGVKTGMRLNDAVQICPDLIPIETHPSRYREFHQKIMGVLKKYSEHVIPKSIDEAIVDLTGYHLVYKNKEILAKKIKQDITQHVGDWLQCSIGIAPNVFLAKLATEIQKPNGLVVITKENIDTILSHLKLTDLPGIAKGMELQLNQIGIFTPLQLKNISGIDLKRKLKSVVGYYWYCRLNFLEVDLTMKNYKSMQAMRQISQKQRQSVQGLIDLFHALCFTLERRMFKQDVLCKKIYFQTRYENNTYWKQKILLNQPTRNASKIIEHISFKIEQFEKTHVEQGIFNKFITSISVAVSDFVQTDVLQIDLFENNVKDFHLQKTVYELKDKYGSDKIVKAIELTEEKILKDVIGFGSVKDMYIANNEGYMDVGFDVM